VRAVARETETTILKSRIGHLQLGSEGNLPSLGGATGWLNSRPLTPADLRGHVVLIDFWTYTCINWLRTPPYVRAWAQRYGARGLVVIGVHTPEFAFERDVDNVRQPVGERGIGYPVAIDSDYAVWRAFNNRYWPALYFVDAQGVVRHHLFGEGDYERSERVIQELLTDAGIGGVDHGPVAVEGRGVEAPADWAALQYQLVRQPGPVDAHTFEIEFLDPAVEAYVFTFG